jgi:hypothetical protein
VAQGVPPCLVIEVVSPKDSRIRRTDEVDKVALYEQVGVREYILVDLPRRATAHRFRLKGYRLGPDGRYRLIEPDREGPPPLRSHGSLVRGLPAGGLDPSLRRHDRRPSPESPRGRRGPEGGRGGAGAAARRDRTAPGDGRVSQTPLSSGPLSHATSKLISAAPNGAEAARIISIAPKSRRVR